MMVRRIKFLDTQIGLIAWNGWLIGSIKSSRMIGPELQRTVRSVPKCKSRPLPFGRPTIPDLDAWNGWANQCWNLQELFSCTFDYSVISSTTREIVRWNSKSD